MGEEDINISYETLFELLRREKYKDDIQKLPESFYSDVLTYISEKKEEISDVNQTVDLMKATENARLRNQLNNIVRLLTELYDRREKKIMMLALNMARTDSSIIDTTNLLDEEKMLFTKLVESLQYYRKGILISLFEGKNVDVMGGPPVKLEVTDVKQPKKESSGAQGKQATAAETSADEDEQGTEDVKKMVRFTHAVPKFVGKELEVYGPFEEEDVANLPHDIADLLIKKGRAVEISSQ